MIDRGEAAQERKRERELDRRPGEADQDGRSAHAEKEQHHHRAPAPLIAQLARGQGNDAEKEKRCGVVWHEVLPSREAELQSDGGHGGRENQQEHVIDRVADIEEQHGGPVVHASMIVYVATAMRACRAHRRRINSLISTWPQAAVPRRGCAALLRHPAHGGCRANHCPHPLHDGSLQFLCRSRNAGPFPRDYLVVG